MRVSSLPDRNPSCYDLDQLCPRLAIGAFHGGTGAGIQGEPGYFKTRFASRASGRPSGKLPNGMSCMNTCIIKPFRQGIPLGLATGTTAEQTGELRCAKTRPVLYDNRDRRKINHFTVLSLVLIP